MLKVIVDEIITKIFELHFHTYFDEKLQVKQLIILCKTSVFFYQKHILSTYTVWILQKFTLTTIMISDGKVSWNQQNKYLVNYISACFHEILFKWE